METNTGLKEELNEVKSSEKEQISEEASSEEKPTDFVGADVDCNELINQTGEGLTTAIAKAQTKQELEVLYQQFHLNNTKKDALRIHQLNNLLDQVNKEAMDRFTRRSGEMTNKEVLDYMTVVQNQIERYQKTVDDIKDIPTIQVNNTQSNTVNIHVGTEGIPQLTKDSRDRIIDLIDSIVKENNKGIVFNMSKEDQNITETGNDPVIEAEVKEEVNPEDDDFVGDD